MNMDAFWCITLSTILLVWWLKNHVGSDVDDTPDPEPPRYIIANSDSDEDIEAIIAEDIAKDKAKKQRDKEVKELQKQGYTDELIAVILPTINNDK